MQKIKLQFPLRFLIIAAFVALALSMVITTSAESISATIIEDGQSRTVKVSSTETQDILEEAGITIQSKDVVTRSDSEGIVIEIERAVPVTLDTGSHVYKVYGSKGDTVQDILDEQAAASGKIGNAHVAAVVAVLDDDIEVAAPLPGEIGDAVRDAGRYADDVVEHQIIIQEGVHDAAAEDRAERAAL